MTDTFEDYEGTVNIGGRTIANVRFADDIDDLAGEEKELAKLVERLDKVSTTYGLEISTEKNKLMTNNTSSINKEIREKLQKLKTVTSFKNLCSVVFDEGSKPEILSKIAQTTATLTRLKPVWNYRSISLSSKIRHAPLSRPSSCVLVNHGPSQYSCKKKTSHGNEVLPQDGMHLIQRAFYQQRSLCQGSAGNWTTQRPDHCKETQTEVVWTCLSFIRF